MLFVHGASFLVETNTCAAESLDQRRRAGNVKYGVT